ncbi:hypothetical protein [Sulfitobacter sp. R18_1]|uniref:hypothetical protein n=1 Tax=Sulfitobacter sp. R18_1 TaxID=2821104 RepID=UPI001ADCAF98|nr:hypothetical protein [Sulfitobacter sp. R18_1]MBO9430603.1 hypothetical protein [Sulfitobacter sp. R18_1]
MTIWDRIKRAWCERFHAGGYVCRDSLGRINWKCDTCGRLSKPVTFEAKIEAIYANNETLQQAIGILRGQPVTPHRYEADMAEMWGPDCAKCGRPVWDKIHDTEKENV